MVQLMHPVTPPPLPCCLVCYRDGRKQADKEAYTVYANYMGIHKFYVIIIAL